jgi:hypothetical protein
MRPERFRSEALVQLLRRQGIVTMEQMKDALGTAVEMTVFRKLREIDYLSSYSHRGKFYTLEQFAEFNRLGLWSYQGVHFSRFGSLLQTAEQLVLVSPRGYFASELAQQVHVEVKEPLLTLVRTKRIAREQVSSRYLYCSPDATTRRSQLLTRSVPPAGEPFEPWPDTAVVASDETRAAIILFLSTLNEKQRRLYAGLESMRLGRGGDRRIAEITAMDVHTIAKGRRELRDRDLKLDRIRAPGGGRKAVEKKRPR